MKKSLPAAIGIIIVLTISSFVQNPIVIDLHKQVKNKGIKVFNRELTLINEQGYAGVRLSKDEGEGIAWIKGVEFSNGTIEFDVRGEDVKQHSFVGIAFHGKDDATFDAIYLRPFQFKSEDENLRSHSIQYISLPDFTWRILREKFPNKFEHTIDPTPDPNSWVHIKIVVKDALVSTYVNGNQDPSMSVNKVTSLNTGSIGFYVADTSGGDFANLKITKAN